MPDIPEEAVRAAEAARLRVFTEAPFMARTTSEEVTRIMLEAAAPAMAEHVAAKILAHMEEHERPLPPDSKVADTPNRQARRRHFRTAAQLATRAFMTDDDLKRAAARKR